MKNCITWGNDGYSRKIVYLHASDNNRAESVFKLFLRATSQFGWPSRVRSDKGGENIDVCRAMLSVRGLGRSSHIAGASVHNQRIERLWRDTFRCVCHTFYALFCEMEDCGLLSANNEVELFCLHYIFIPRLNLQLNRFIESWNDHHLRTENGLSPNQMWLRGMCEPTFEAVVDTDYGVEFNDREPNPFDTGIVNVPQVSVNLSQQQIQLLAVHNPLSPSEYNGLDKYVEVCKLVREWLN